MLGGWETFPVAPGWRARARALAADVAAVGALLILLMLLWGFS